jgi:hypothetical protein
MNRKKQNFRLKDPLRSSASNTQPTTKRIAPFAMNSPLHINELRVHVPGLTSEQGRRLGQALARRLANVPLKPAYSRRIPALAVRLCSSGATSVERMAEQIVAEIQRSVK